MATLADPIPKNYEEAVEILSAWHGSDQRREDLRIYAFDDDDTKEDRERIVRLLEVSPSHAPLGEALPLGFGRAATFPYRSEIVVVTPEEWDRIASRNIGLPAGWDAEAGRKVWPRDGE